jgi:hypothetical protein
MSARKDIKHGLRSDPGQNSEVDELHGTPTERNMVQAFG